MSSSSTKARNLALGPSPLLICWRNDLPPTARLSVHADSRRAGRSLRVRSVQPITRRRMSSSVSQPMSLRSAVTSMMR
jgi:hypothetical protein